MPSKIKSEKTHIRLAGQVTLRSPYSSISVLICQTCLFRPFSQCGRTSAGPSFLYLSWPIGCLPSRLPDKHEHWKEIQIIWMETSLNLDNPRKTGVVGHLQHAAQHFNSVQLNFIYTTTVAWRRLILKDKCSTILKRNKENPNNHMTPTCASMWLI